MKVIYKYPLMQPVTELELTPDSEVIHVETQHGFPTLWIIVNLVGQKVKRTFIGAPTGGAIEDNVKFLGTATNVHGDGLVFHIFERL